MIKIDNVGVCGIQHAIRGMRNPMNSWDKSDSGFCWNFDCDHCNARDTEVCKVASEEAFYIVGDNDLDLMGRLFRAGNEHRKYMRMMMVYMDITAPLYWWKEFDTYKVGTVANSCSTMHKLTSKEFTREDFSCEHLMGKARVMLEDYIIPQLNEDREMYLETKIKDDWWQMIQLLPESYNQKRTVMINYETAVSIIKQRSAHKLDEWHQLVDVLKNLPYMVEITAKAVSDADV